MMNTEKVKTDSLKQSRSVGLHAVENALIMPLSLSVSLSHSLLFCPFVEHFSLSSSLSPNDCSLASI